MSLGAAVFTKSIGAGVTVVEKNGEVLLCMPDGKALAESRLPTVRIVSLLRGSRSLARSLKRHGLS